MEARLIQPMMDSLELKENDDLGSSKVGRTDQKNPRGLDHRNLDFSMSLKPRE